MSVFVSGPRIGEMNISTNGLDRAEIQSLERGIRQRGFSCTIMRGGSGLIVKINIGSLHTSQVRTKLEEIHASINDTVAHKVTQKKKALAVTTA